MASGCRYKIVVFGAFGAGKTTLIQTLDPGSKHVEADCPGGTTTVALDFGRFESSGRLIFLFGTPGQERFEFAREIIAKGMDGALLLIDASTPVDDFSRQLYASLSGSKIPFMVLLNKWERTPGYADQIRQEFAGATMCPITAIDQKSSSDVLAGFVATLPQKDT